MVVFGMDTRDVNVLRDLPPTKVFGTTKLSKQC